MCVCETMGDREAYRSLDFNIMSQEHHHHSIKHSSRLVQVVNKCCKKTSVFSSTKIFTRKSPHLIIYMNCNMNVCVLPH